MSRIFGTDGVRGIANSDLDSMLAYNLGRAGAYVLTEEAHHKPKIALGKDTRVSCDMLEAALIAGICSMGGEAVVLGVQTTPAVAYLTRHYNFDAGIMISASHNSYEYNGIKFFDSKGYKLSDELEDRIQKIIEESEYRLPNPTGIGIGKKTEINNATLAYINFLKSTVNIDLTGMKIAIDCANGSSYIAAPLVLSDLGAEVIVINNEPDGININKNCGSTHPEILQKIVIESGADVGFAFDGDADRLIAIDNNGALINGDYIIAICAKHMKRSGTLKKNTVVSTIMSNMGLEIALKEEKCSICRTKVGDRYVLEEMVKNGYNFGGEQSGHIIFLDHNTTGDGILTALKLLSVMKETGLQLSELKSIIKELPQVLINAKIKNGNKNRYLDDVEIKNAIDDILKSMENKGRVVIRPSGTEPLVRVMLEGENETLIRSYAESLASLIEKKLL
ncbi:MAG: phosphoglucosamine mutase [Firmicutes bacterium]|nr:phosphoglucosamine mutase [Bacillota bacterium]